MKIETFIWKCNLDADFMLFTELSTKTAASFLMAGGMMMMMIAGRSSRLVITLRPPTLVTHKTTI